MHSSQVVGRHMALSQRCCDEALELQQAVATGDRALILDEVVDVLYFVRAIRHQYGLTADMVRKYAERKASIRSTSGRDKVLEIALARLITSGSASLGPTEGVYENIPCNARGDDPPRVV